MSLLPRLLFVSTCSTTAARAEARAISHAASDAGALTLDEGSTPVTTVICIEGYASVTRLKLDALSNEIALDLTEKCSSVAASYIRGKYKNATSNIYSLLRRICARNIYNYSACKLSSSYFNKVCKNV